MGRPRKNPIASEEAVESSSVIEESNKKADKHKSILEGIRKKYGNYSNWDSVQPVDTGSVILNAILEKKGRGIPRGQCIRLAGEAGKGKSTIALSVARRICETGAKCVYIDSEFALNLDTIESFGLDQYLDNEFTWIQECKYQDVHDIVSKVVEEPEVVCIFIDSLQSLVTEAIMSEEFNVEVQKIGADAQITGNILKHWRPICKKNGCILFVISQVRVTGIGGPYGTRPKTVAAGANAQKHSFDIDLFLKGQGEKNTIRDEKECSWGELEDSLIGETVLLQNIKNRRLGGVNVPITVIHGKGVSNFHAYKMWLEHNGNIKKSGAWFIVDLNGTKEKIHGEPAVIEYLKNNSEFVKQYISDNGGFTVGGVSSILTSDSEDYDESEENISNESED